MLNVVMNIPTQTYSYMNLISFHHFIIFYLLIYGKSVGVLLERGLRCEQRPQLQQVLRLIHGPRGDGGTGIRMEKLNFTSLNPSGLFGAVDHE